METSGNCPINNGVIAACILVIDENDNVVDEFVRYVCPPDLTRRNWSEEARIEAHKIEFETVKTFMPNDQFCYELLCFLAKYKSFFPLQFICHSSPTGFYKRDKITGKTLGSYTMIPWFDYNFLEWCFRKATFKNGTSMVYSFFKILKYNEVCIEIEEGKKDKNDTVFELLNRDSSLISTIHMARFLKYKGNRANEWATRLGFDLKHHDAKSDTYLCLEVYKYLKQIYYQELRERYYGTETIKKDKVKKIKIKHSNQLFLIN